MTCIFNILLLTQAEMTNYDIPHYRNLRRESCTPGKSETYEIQHLNRAEKENEYTEKCVSLLRLKSQFVNLQGVAWDPDQSLWWGVRENVKRETWKTRVNLQESMVIWQGKATTRAELRGEQCSDTGHCRKSRKEMWVEREVKLKSLEFTKATCRAAWIGTSSKKPYTLKTSKHYIALHWLPQICKR